MGGLLRVNKDGALEVAAMPAREPRPVRGAAVKQVWAGWVDAGDADELLRHVAYLESNPSQFRSLTSLDVDEARDLYDRARSLAAEGPAPGGGEGRHGGGGGDGNDSGGGKLDFMPYGRFLMALSHARKTDEILVDYVFRAKPGTTLKAFDAALPLLLEIRDMPRRFARWLVPFGYKLDAKPNRGKGSGSILDYME